MYTLLDMNEGIHFDIYRVIWLKFLLKQEYRHSYIDENTSYIEKPMGFISYNLLKLKSIPYCHQHPIIIKKKNYWWCPSMEIEKLKFTRLLSFRILQFTSKVIYLNHSDKILSKRTQLASYWMLDDAVIFSRWHKDFIKINQ